MFIVLIILFLALSIDNYLVTNEKGANLKALDFKTSLGYSLAFVICNLIALFLAFEIDFLIDRDLNEALKLFLIVTPLVLNSFIFLSKAFNKKEVVERLDSNFNFGRCIYLAFISAFDTFLASISLFLLGLDLFYLIPIAILSAIISALVGLKVGNYYGAMYQRRLLAVAGIIYLLCAFWACYYWVVL